MAFDKPQKAREGRAAPPDGGGARTRDAAVAAIERHPHRACGWINRFGFQLPDPPSMGSAIHGEGRMKH